MPPSMLSVVGLVDANGVPYSLLNPLPTSASGGGGSSAVTVADGADVAQGATTDAASALTVNGLLKNIKATLAGPLTVAGSIAVSNFPVSQTVTGTVTANIGTTGTLALDATLTGGTQKSQLTDGTNAVPVVNTAPTTQYGLVVRQVPATATAPNGVQLSDGSASYTAAKTGQFPTVLGITTKAASLSIALASDQVGTAGSPSTTVVTVQGSAANGAAVSGNPNFVAGTDGSATRALSTDTGGKLKSAGAATFRFINSLATTVCLSGAGILRSVIIGAPGTGTAIVVYDNTSATGTIIASLAGNVQGALFFNVAVSLGITVVTSTGTPASITVTWDT